jgi:hypothetical protein
MPFLENITGNRSLPKDKEFFGTCQRNKSTSLKREERQGRILRSSLLRG